MKQEEKNPIEDTKKRQEEFFSNIISIKMKFLFLTMLRGENEEEEF